MNLFPVIPAAGCERAVCVTIVVAGAVVTGMVAGLIEDGGADTDMYSPGTV